MRRAKGVERGRRVDSACLGLLSTAWWNEDEARVALGLEPLEGRIVSEQVQPIAADVREGEVFGDEVPAVAGDLPRPCVVGAQRCHGARSLVRVAAQGDVVLA